jgi:hypothetical protein
MFRGVTWPEAWVYIVAFIVVGGVCHKLINYLIFSLHPQPPINVSKNTSNDKEED